MFGYRPAADRYQIGDQAERGVLLIAIEMVVCGVLGHRASVLQYDDFVLEEIWDAEEEEWVQAARDEQRPYLGCIRCLAEVELPLPPPVPIDIVDWE